MIYHVATASPAKLIPPLRFAGNKVVSGIGEVELGEIIANSVRDARVGYLSAEEVSANYVPSSVVASAFKPIEWVRANCLTLDQLRAAVVVPKKGNHA